MDTLGLDVAIVGGGLAGTLLARQLRRTLPALSVGVFEREADTSFKVGESTVEIASNYLIRRLGLSSYLYDRHLPKNGLRFFFDTEARDANLEQMSEIGTLALPYHPSFQINRARLESDLRERNAADGVLVRAGVRVTDVELGSGGALHRFVVGDEERRERCEARWLIDAAGRASIIARLKGLRVPESEHAIAAVWGRFTGVEDLDGAGTPAFRARVRHSSRMLSTVHFCYPGYWIWFIPLREGIISVGVVGEKAALDASCRTKAGFLAFLQSHRAVAALLVHAELVDLGSYGHLPYATRQYFSADRWGMTGEAAAFADPFYSPGSDYIALENDFLTDLIRRDVSGATAAQLQESVDLYDPFMAFRHEAAMRLYRGLYQTLGSYELLKLKWQFDISSYYNLWLDPYMQDQHLDAAFLVRQLRERIPVLQALANFAALFRKVEKSLKERGQFYRANLDHYCEPLGGLDHVRDVGTPHTREQILDRTRDSFNSVRSRALDLLEGTCRARAPLSFARFMVDRPLA